MQICRKLGGFPLQPRRSRKFAESIYRDADRAVAATGFAGAGTAIRLPPAYGVHRRGRCELGRSDGGFRYDHLRAGNGGAQLAGGGGGRHEHRPQGHAARGQGTGHDGDRPVLEPCTDRARPEGAWRNAAARISNIRRCSATGTRPWTTGCDEPFPFMVRRLSGDAWTGFHGTNSQAIDFNKIFVMDVPKDCFDQAPRAGMRYGYPARQADALSWNSRAQGCFKGAGYPHRTPTLSQRSSVPCAPGWKLSWNESSNPCFY